MVGFIDVFKEGSETFHGGDRVVLSRKCVTEDGIEHMLNGLDV